MKRQVLRKDYFQQLLQVEGWYLFGPTEKKPGDPEEAVYELYTDNYESPKYYSVNKSNISYEEAKQRCDLVETFDRDYLKPEELDDIETSWLFDYFVEAMDYYAGLSYKYSDEYYKDGYEDDEFLDSTQRAHSLYDDEDGWDPDTYLASFGKPNRTPEESKKFVDDLCKSDTIVFHQEDKTTVMLDPIYEGRGWDVFKGSFWSDGISREEIAEIIKRHDKVICLGHGTSSGLLSGIISEAEVPLLKEKKVFALWCYAATYFKKNGFEGHGVFCSDNCPSEVWECKAACGADVSAEWIYNNMLYLSDCIKDVIDLTWENPEEACRIAKEKYSQAEATTEDEKKVVEFNTNTLQVV